MTTEEAYRLYFQKLSRFVEFLKAIIKEFDIQLPPPLEIKQGRDKLLQTFRDKRAVSACASCAGKCCYQHGSPMYFQDLLYILLKNPDFVLPEPDYQYLNENNPDTKDRETIDGTTRKEWSPRDRQWESYCAIFKYQPWAYRFKCVFGSGNGCRLGPDRPQTCLEYICKTLRETSGIGLDYNCRAYNPDDPITKWVRKLENKINEAEQQIKERLEQNSRFLKGFGKSEVREFALTNLLYFDSPWLTRKLSLPKSVLAEKEKLRIKTMRGRNPNPGCRTSYYDEDLSPNLIELLLLINIEPPN